MQTDYFSSSLPGCRIAGWLFCGLLATSSAMAAPSVDGLQIVLPDDGWYQVQSANDFRTLCEGVRRCEVPPGEYIVINHSTGQRFDSVRVVAASSGGSGIDVSGGRLSWPDDGWYQVQSEPDFRSVCEGGTSCEVAPGRYTVINHTTGQRFSGIEVVATGGGGGGDGGGGESGIAVSGNVISWSGDDWYQIQSAADFTTICEGGNSCTVTPGRYNVINHSTGVRIENLEVSSGAGGGVDSPPSMPVNLRGTAYSGTDAEIFWDASTDDGFVMGYDIFRNGEKIQDRLDARSLFESALQPGTLYEYRVVAIDDDNNQSLAAITTLTTSGTPATPPVSAADTVAAAQAPIIDGGNQVSWAFSPVASDLQLLLEPYVEMPLARNGRPARWNDLETLGNRIFVVDEQDGSIVEITNREARLWFQVSDAMLAATGRWLNTENLFHGGVRGIAFHPDFATNGKLYMSVLEQRPATPELHTYLSDAASINADSVLLEWTVNPATMQVDTTSYREVFRVGIPQYDHPIKQIAFDPSQRPGDADYGLLYIAHGDGSEESTTAVGGQGNNALGKILRINPLASGDSPYSVPGSNPFVGSPDMLDEVYSLGHRNPHHLAFMRDGTLLVAEDGRDNIDEVNVILPGADYGWSQREGAYVQLERGRLSTGIATLPADDAVNGYEYPVIQFGHYGTVGATFLGQALGGGFVMENGSELDGRYFYIDFPKTGDLFYSEMRDVRAAVTTGAPESLRVARTWELGVAFDHDNNTATPALDTTLNAVITGASGHDGTDRVDVRFGQGPDGELFLLSKRNNQIYLVRNSVGPGSSLAEASGTDSSEAPGLGKPGTDRGDHGFSVWDRMSAAAASVTPSDCLLSEAREGGPYYCFSPYDRRLMRIENSGEVRWQFPLPGENSSNHIESIDFINGMEVAIIADATPSPDDSAFDMSTFRQTGAYIGTFHIIPDIENPDGTDFAGVNLDGTNLIVRAGPLRESDESIRSTDPWTSDLYVYGEHYSEIPGADATVLSGWRYEGAFRARIDSRSGATLHTRLFPGMRAWQAEADCAVPGSAGVDANACY